MYVLQHLSTPSIELMKELQTLFYLLEATKLFLELQYTTSKNNIILDLLPCFLDKEDYRLAKFLAHLGTVYTQDQTTTIDLRPSEIIKQLNTTP